MSKALIVCGLGFGDEGKGTITDFLTREQNAHTVIRFNGGAQAAHNVVTNDGLHHTFSQFGSGTLVPGTRTHLSRFMLVDPSALANEHSVLWNNGITDAYQRLTIDGSCLVTTRWHRMVNQARERARGAGAHGTCGMGIGETVSWALEYPDYALRMWDLRDPKVLMEKFAWQEARALREFPEIGSSAPPLGAWFDLALKLQLVDGEETSKILRREGTVIFEGAQGVLLDQDYGFSPYTTWSKTTSENAITLISEAGNAVKEMTRIGVIRSYMTRHGAGPMVTQSGVRYPERHNASDGAQGAFRTGELDFPALTYAVKCMQGVDEIAVTHMDRIHAHVCLSYTTDFRPDAAYLAECRPLYHRLRFASEAELSDIIQSELNAPVTIRSWGPKPGQKRRYS